MCHNTQIEYIIDGKNRRIGRRVNGVVTNRWLYAGQQHPIADLDSAGKIIAIYHGNYLKRGDTLFSIIRDHLGSVRMVVNVETGEIVQRIDYDAWGNVISDSNPGFQPFGYAGGIYDSATELVRFGSRDYSILLGRWISDDHIRFAGGSSNLYEYCLDDPINFVDLLGLQQIGIHVHLGGGSTGVGSPSSGGWGHAWVDLYDANGNRYGRGFYPSDPAGWQSIFGGTYGKAFVDDTEDGEEANESFTINISQADYDAAMALIQYLEQNSPDWSIDNNCADFVDEVLTAAGIDHPDFQTLGKTDPNKIADWLKEMKSKNQKCSNNKGN